MGNVNDRLIKVPNADCWIDKTAVIAVARVADSVLPGSGDPGISVVNFNIRLIDGKAVNIQSPNRNEIGNFLHAIGVTWEA